MTGDYKYIWFVLLLPLFGFIWQALGGPIVLKNLGPKLGRTVMGVSAVLPILGAFGIAAVLTAKLAQQDDAHRLAILTLFDWIHVQTLSVPFEFRVDTLSMTMVLIITGIGTLIHLYATGYMSEEQDFSRFFTYLNLFISAMLILVLGNNLVMLFVGWEGVGVCSYLLIGFWYKDVNNSKAANKAFIVNRIGDYGLTLGMFLIVALLGANYNLMHVTDGRWLSYDVLMRELPHLVAAYPQIFTAIALLLFVGAMGKSAQFPLYIWLPDAMAGPTPVSALIHAATMVTSGVFLLNRMYFVFLTSDIALSVVAITGAVTALLGALIAFGQTDIKKVLAFSTVSQLGYMFIACGSGAMWAGMFHVTTHAFFKALLFLGAGAVIHAMSHDQDMRNYGKLFKYLRGTGTTMLIGWIAIAGIAPLAGFWSKDEALGAAVNSQMTVLGMHPAQIAGWVGFFVAFLTAWYMTRMTLLTFFSGTERWRSIVPDHDHHHEHAHAHEHGHDGHDHHGEDVHGFFMSEAEVEAARPPEEEHHALDKNHTPHEVPWTMLVPLLVLAVASLAGGWLLKFPLGFEHWLYPLAEEAKDHQFSELTLIVISQICAVAGIAMGVFQYSRQLPANEGFDMAKWSPFRRSALKQFKIDYFLADGSIAVGGVVGNFLAGFDKYFIDGIVNGVASLTSGLGGIFGRFQTGYVRSYALLVQLGAVAMVAYFVYVVMKLGGAQ